MAAPSSREFLQVSTDQAARPSMKSRPVIDKELRPQTFTDFDRLRFVRQMPVGAKNFMGACGLVQKPNGGWLAQAAGAA